jgi:hypothetical protein
MSESKGINLPTFHSGVTFIGGCYEIENGMRALVSDRATLDAQIGIQH